MTDKPKFQAWDRVKVVRDGPDRQCIYKGSEYGTVQIAGDGDWVWVVLDGMCASIYHVDQLEKAEPQQDADGHRRT